MRPTPASATLTSGAGGGRRRPSPAAVAPPRGEAVEPVDRRLPVHAGVGDRLAVGQRVAVGDVLPAADEEGLEHDADDRAAAAGDLLADLRGDERLALVVLAAVVVRGVDDEPLR